jgi:hypothetical protein
VQIVHVHGSHWFYDCCNLKGEIVGQARLDSAGTMTMGHLLDRILAEYSPIVVGYSGWKENVLMSALLRRLQQPSLPYNLYWFCHRHSDAADLPEEVRLHSSPKTSA